MKVFIAGASGLVGSNCMAHFKGQGWEVVGSYFSYPTDETVFYNTLNPQHQDNFNVLRFNPDIIVHCGAMTHVDLCESEPEKSYQQTVESTKNLLEVASQCNARFVYLSTDYVFDGTDGPYTEAAPVNPLSVYAKHKLEAEQMALSASENTLVLRVTNIYGNEERGKNFVARIISQCRAGEKLILKLPYDQYATPTNALDIARAMFLLLRDGKSGIYHIGSTDFMNRVQLAFRVLKYFPDAKFEMIPLSTKELNQPAKRPLIGGFVTTKFCSEYPEFQFTNVDDFVKAVLD